MALGIVEIYLGSPFSANRHCSRSVCLRSVVVDPWGLHPQTSMPQVALPLDPQTKPIPHCEFLATRLPTLHCL